MEVFPSVDRLEIYANEAGTITLSQDDPMGGDPALIVVPLNMVDAVSDALYQAKREAMDMDQDDA